MLRLKESLLALADAVLAGARCYGAGGEEIVSIVA
jgi:hypothetical protein